MQSPSCVVLRQLQKFTELSQRNFKSHEAFAVFFICVYMQRDKYVWSDHKGLETSNYSKFLFPLNY